MDRARSATDDRRAPQGSTSWTDAALALAGDEQAWSTNPPSNSVSAAAVVAFAMAATPITWAPAMFATARAARPLTVVHAIGAHWMAVIRSPSRAPIRKHHRSIQREQHELVDQREGRKQGSERSPRLNYPNP